MKKIKLLTLLVTTTFLSYGQTNTDNSDNCFNGIKDGTETGVDCGGICDPCNGEAQIIYNNKELKTGKIIVSNSMLKNLTGKIIEKDRINYSFLYFPFSYMNKNEKVELALNFKYIRFGKMEPKKIYLTGGTDRDMEWVKASPEQGAMLYVHENFVFLTITKGVSNESIIKLKDKSKYNYILEITNVNNIERYMSGKIILTGATADGTPIDIIGTFENVSY